MGDRDGKGLGPSSRSRDLTGKDKPEVSNSVPHWMFPHRWGDGLVGMRGHQDGRGLGSLVPPETGSRDP